MANTEYTTDYMREAEKRIRKQREEYRAHSEEIIYRELEKVNKAIDSCDCFDIALGMMTVQNVRTTLRTEHPDYKNDKQGEEIEAVMNRIFNRDCSGKYKDVPRLRTKK